MFILFFLWCPIFAIDSANENAITRNNSVDIKNSKAHQLPFKNKHSNLDCFFQKWSFDCSVMAEVLLRFLYM